MMTHVDLRGRPRGRWPHADAARRWPDLHAEGKLVPGKTSKFRDVIAFQDDDNRTLTSFMQGDDGEWMQIMQERYRRRSRARGGASKPDASDPVQFVAVPPGVQQGLEAVVGRGRHACSCARAAVRAPSAGSRRQPAGCPGRRAHGRSRSFAARPSAPGWSPPADKPLASASASRRSGPSRCKPAIRRCTLTCIPFHRAHFSAPAPRCTIRIDICLQSATPFRGSCPTVVGDVGPFGATFVANGERRAFHFGHAPLAPASILYKHTAIVNLPMAHARRVCRIHHHDCAPAHPACRGGWCVSTAFASRSRARSPGLGGRTRASLPRPVARRATEPCRPAARVPERL